MKQTPCEYMKWNGLPVIRREFANSMIHEFGLSQNETAKNLGITPAAVSQYMSNKRGKIKINDENLLNEIQISAKNIIKNKEKAVIKETCRICKIMRNKGLIPLICETCINNK